MSYKLLQGEDAKEDNEDFEVELKVFASHAEDGEMRPLAVIDADTEGSTGEVYSSSGDEGRVSDTNKLMAPDEQTMHVEGEDGHYEDYEVVLRVVGFGLFHILLLLGVGVALCSDAVEVLSISFVLPFLRQAKEISLVDWQSGLLSAIIFLGMLFGSYIWGGLADISGRRQTLVVSLTVNGVFGAISSLSPNFYVLLFFRFMSGLGVGGSLPIIPMYLSEFIHSSYRGPYLGALSAFWMFGALLCGALAWLLLPLEISGVAIGSLPIHSWRVFLALSAIPSILGAVVFFLLPESPRFLLEVNKEMKAVKTLNRAFLLNHLGRRTNHPFPIKSITLQKLQGTSSWRRLTEDKWYYCFKNFLINMAEVFMRWRKLFKLKLLRRTLMLMAIYFCISFSTYGVTLWYPTYVDHLQQLGEDEALESVCNLTLANETVQFDEGYQKHLLCDCPLTVYDNITFTNVSIGGGWVLSGGSLISSSISGSNLTAVLSEGSTWTNIEVTDVLFINSSFSGGVWDSVTLRDVRFEKSVFCGVDVSSSLKLLGVELIDCIVNGEPLNTSNKTAILSALQSSPDCSLSSVDSGQCSEPELETDYFAEYLDDFVIAASSFPSTVVAAIAVYFFRRSFLMC